MAEKSKRGRQSKASEKEEKETEFIKMKMEAV